MKMNSNLLIVCATLTLSFSLLAQDAKPAAPATPRVNPGERALNPNRPRPQTGKVIGIDKAASAITVGPMEGAPAATALTSNVVINIATNTMFLKAGKKITLDDLAVGDQVRFALRKTPEGKESAAFIVVGGTPVRPRATPATPAPNR